MTTIAQTMKDDSGANWSGSIRFTAWGRIGGLTGDDHAPVTVTVTAGALSTSLRGPSYYQVEVGKNRPYLILLPGSGTVTLDEIRVGGSEAQIGSFWYANIAALLAESSGDWTQAGTINSYGSDGIISGWQLILKTDPAASSLSDNGDSVLETDDGDAYAVRTWISG